MTKVNEQNEQRLGGNFKKIQESATEKTRSQL